MNAFFDQAQQFTRMWADVASRMVGAALSADPATPPPQAARDARGAAFQALSQYADQYMRSPQFLEMAKQSIDSSIALRKQWNDFFTDVRHGTEGVARRDVDGVVLTLRHLENRTLDRLEELGQRLVELAARLEQIDSRVAAVEQRLERPPGKPSNGVAARPAGRRQHGRNGGAAAGERRRTASPRAKPPKPKKAAKAGEAAKTARAAGEPAGGHTGRAAESSGSGVAPAAGT